MMSGAVVCTLVFAWNRVQSFLYCSRRKRCKQTQFLTLVSNHETVLREQRASPARAGPAARANPARANPAQPEPAQPQPAQPDCPPLTFQHSAGTAHPTPAQPSPPQPSPAQPSPAQPTRYLASQGGAAQGTCHSIRSDLIKELRTGPGILDQSGAARGSS